MQLLDVGIGVLLPALLIGCGLYMTVYLRGFYFLHPLRTLRCMGAREGAGTVSPLRALSVSLAGTLGVGNLVGVAVALTLGGAGAVFWMWVSALCAMVLKYAEIVLSLRYRERKNGVSVGGPMYYMKNGVGGRTGAVMARLFALCGVLSSFVVGNIVQMNAAADAACATFRMPKLLVGMATALFCGILVFGGYRLISHFTAIVIPTISFLYIGLSVWVLLSEASRLPAVLSEIFEGAFSFDAAAGGVLGSLFSGAIRQGVAKGAFSHEAGNGTAPMAHAGSDTKIPAKQGILGIFEVFFDTILICSLTAFVLLLARDGDFITENGMRLVIYSFSRFYGKSAAYFVSGSIVIFAFSTVVCWAYYGQTCFRCLVSSRRMEKGYLLLYCGAALVGAVLPQSAVWELSDLSVALMTTLNLSAVLWLRREVLRETEAAGLCLPPKR